MNKSINELLNKMRQTEVPNESDINSSTKDNSELWKEMQKDVESLSQSIVELSKTCLTELNDINQYYIDMSRDITSMEGMIKVIKDAAGNSTLIQGVDVPRIDYEDEIPYTNGSEEAVSLPAGDYVLNFSALDQIGQTVENIKDNIGGMPLIREITPDDNSPQLWTQQEDYFVESQSRTADPTKSSFVLTYNIEPSLYPPNPRLSQRSVTQSQIDTNLF